MWDSMLQAASLALLFLLLVQRLDLCASLNDEGRVLLRFRERVEFDPYGALAGWEEKKSLDPCSWFGVECSDDGRVVALNLQDLFLEGTLASELGKLTHMMSLVLHNNSFYGIIPREIADLQKLVILDLGHNNLSGPLPSGLNNILSLEILILGNNRYIGTSELPIGEDHLSLNTESVKRSVENATIRRLLQLGNKHKGGHHRRKKNQTRSSASPARTLSPSPSPSPSPSSRLSSKSRSFPSPSPFLSPFYPPEISPSPRPTLLISIPSPVPSPSLNTKTPLRAPHLSLPFVPISDAPSPSIKHKYHHWKVYTPILSGASFLLASTLICILCCRANKVVTVRPWSTGLSGQLQKAFVSGVPALKRSELEISCEDFSNIIGSLPDCQLYKGTLSSGVEIVVMSSLITSAKDWSKQSEALFRKKISMLSKVNHKNFINLLGYCEEGEPFTRMMVFEYAPNGTLFEHLHVKEAEPLDWSARLRVAMGIAYCLEYMHQLNPPVILRNLDSSSIYLTDDYAAKISDIGFSSAAEEAGPLDPPKPDSKSIVYKFGVILLELLSGRAPFSKEEGVLEQWALVYLTGKRPVREMVDPTLNSLRDEEISALWEVVRACMDPDTEGRPAMVEIARRLRDITAMAPESATPKLSPLWWAELEILSSEAN